MNEFSLAFTIMTLVVPAVLIFVCQNSPVSTWIKSSLALPPFMLPAVFLVFSLNLAFVAGDVWGTYDKARAAVASEGDNLRNVARTAIGIKAPIGKELLLALKRYEEYTVTSGWKELAVSSGGYGEGGSTSNLARIVSSEEMSEAVKPLLQGQLVSQINTLRSARNQRFALSASGLHPAKWLFTCFLCLISVLAVSLATMDKKSHQIVSSVFFFVVSTPTIVLLHMHANPFGGLFPISPQPIQIALDHLTVALGGR